MTRYHLDDLGWLQFEQVCQSLLKAELSLAIESWGGHSSDRGIDSYCAQPLALTKGAVDEGPFVFQVKFMAGANAASAKPEAGLLSAVDSECKHMRTRIAAGVWKHPTHYILITNVPLTAQLRQKVESKFSEVISCKRVISWGASDVCDLLDNHPAIRLAFPQVLTSKDIIALLATTVNKPVLERSRAAVEEAKDLQDVFVPTRAYYRTLDTLVKHHFAVVTGPPEMGKTTIARMIGLGKWVEGWEFVECIAPEDFLGSFDASANQVFIADDAFGTTEYRPELAVPWGRQLSHILRKLNDSHWLIWTSRPTPLHLALQELRLQGNAEHFPEPAEVHVDAAALTVEEKAKILYRHAKMSTLNAAGKQLVKDHAKEIVRHTHFTPERIRRFITDRLPNLISTLKSGDNPKDILSTAIAAEIGEPTKQMRQSFELIHDNHRDFVFAMLDAGSSNPLQPDVHEAYYRLVENRADLPPEKLALDLDGHFIRCLDSPAARKLADRWPESGPRYAWIHPSWRDIAIDFLSERQRSRQSFLSHCGVNGISLALSAGGGASGERISPLLRTQEDWQILGTRMNSIVKEVDNRTLRSILIILRQAIEGNELTDKREVLARLSYDVLNTIRTRQDSDSEPMSVAVLDAYFDLSVVVRPLAPSPDLLPTWQSVWSVVQEQSTEDSIFEMKVEPLADWLELIVLIQDNEPRFLRQLGFPKSCNEVVSRLAENIAEYDKSALCDRDKQTLQGEIEYVESFAKLLEDMHVLFPDVKTDVRLALTALRRAIESLREECDVAPEKHASQIQRDPNERFEAKAPTKKNDSFDVDGLFEDL